jgi:hypothetical protein
MTARHRPLSAACSLATSPPQLQTLAALVLVTALLAALPARGQGVAETTPALPSPAEPSAQQLAQRLSNPLADMVSVPLQFNWEQGVGPEGGTRFVMNFQPVVPFAIGRDWNLVGRMVLPVVGQPVLFPGGEATSGVGDVLLSGFFSPTKPSDGRRKSGAIWGVGPVISLPSNSEPTLGSGRWSAGPTVVLLKQSGRWTSGGLANHLWSFAGNDERKDVEQTFIQPFVAYATPTGVTYSVNSESTASWKAKSGERWTVPVNLTVSKMARFGPFPASYGIGGGYFVDKPTGGADWKLRMAVTIILPKRGAGRP